ncbi:uncharacterized protein LOC134669316 [Cydia fagiglandana]|uniref:uncharacterized protein LOC134669316 n=1 Tax=Cydia fagiglandana TaxID=1458189 RepID=UPI002FEE3484
MINKIRTTACRKGELVRQCLLDELYKILSNKDNGNEKEPGKETVITPETLKVVEGNCRKITDETCVRLCILEKLGVIDERGWYAESKGTEFIKSIFPTDIIIDNQESIIRQIAQTCDRVNQHVSHDCNRGEEVAKCLYEEMDKVLQKNDDGNEMEPEKEIETQVMTNSKERSSVEVDGQIIHYVDEYIYLGQLVSFSNRQDKEVERRVQNAWKSYWSMKELMKGDLPMSLKRKLVDICILPVLTYGAQTWSLTEIQKSKLKITPETLKVVEGNCRKITNETCVRLCILEKLGVIDERGWYAESKGTEFIKSIFPTDIIIDNQESIIRQIAQTCDRVNQHVSHDCNRGEEVAKCLYEEMDKVLQKNDDGNEMEPEKEIEVMVWK